MKYCLDDAYSTSTDNGYGKQLAEQRFKILKQLKPFTSVLDVGSGSCLLQKWLNNNIQHKVDYEAVDIREDALALCDCVKYTIIPVNKNYDISCLFGTITYNIDLDATKNKQILINLLLQCKNISKQIIFTVLKETTEFKILKYKRNKFVYFSKEEIKNMLEKLEINLVAIIETDLDPDEYFVICEINNA